MHRSIKRMVYSCQWVLQAQSVQFRSVWITAYIWHKWCVPSYSKKLLASARIQQICHFCSPNLTTSYSPIFMRKEPLIDRNVTVPREKLRERRQTDGIIYPASQLKAFNAQVVSSLTDTLLKIPPLSLDVENCSWWIQMDPTVLEEKWQDQWAKTDYFLCLQIETSFNIALAGGR